MFGRFSRGRREDDVANGISEEERRQRTGWRKRQGSVERDCVAKREGGLGRTVAACEADGSREGRKEKRNSVRTGGAIRQRHGGPNACHFGAEWYN